MNDPDAAIKCAAATTLGKIAEGTEHPDIAESIAKLLDEPSGQLHLEGGPVNLQDCGALALRELGPVPANIYRRLLTVFDGSRDPTILKSSALSLSTIAGFYQDDGLTDRIEILRQGETLMARRRDVLDDEQQHEIAMFARNVRRARQFLELKRASSIREAAVGFLRGATPALSAAAIIFCLWAAIFLVYPSGLLWFSQQLRPIDNLTVFGLNVKLLVEYVTLLRVFLYNQRVLNHWLSNHVVKMKSSSAVWAAPARLNGQEQQSLCAADLRPLFERRRLVLTIESERNDTVQRFARRLGEWAEEGDVLGLSRRVVAVFVTPHLDMEDCTKEWFLNYIHGQLRARLDLFDSIPDELLYRLLSRGHVLVIVEDFADAPSCFRRAIQPVDPEFSLSTLVICSRLGETLPRGAASSGRLELAAD